MPLSPHRDGVGGDPKIIKSLRAQHRNDLETAAENWQDLFAGRESDGAMVAAMRFDTIMDLVEAFVMAHRKGP